MPNATENLEAYTEYIEIKPDYNLCNEYRSVMVPNSTSEPAKCQNVKYEHGFNFEMCDALANDSQIKVAVLESMITRNKEHLIDEQIKTQNLPVPFKNVEVKDTTEIFRNPSFESHTYNNYMNDLFLTPNLPMKKNPDVLTNIKQVKFNKNVLIKDPWNNETQCEIKEPEDETSNKVKKNLVTNSKNQYKCSCNKNARFEIPEKEVPINKYISSPSKEKKKNVKERKNYVKYHDNYVDVEELFSFSDDATNKENIKQEIPVKDTNKECTENKKKHVNFTYRNSFRSEIDKIIEGNLKELNLKSKNKTKTYNDDLPKTEKYAEFFVGKNIIQNDIMFCFNSKPANYSSTNSEEVSIMQDINDSFNQNENRFRYEKIDSPYFQNEYKHSTERTKIPPPLPPIDFDIDEVYNT